MKRLEAFHASNHVQTWDQAQLYGAVINLGITDDDADLSDRQQAYVLARMQMAARQAALAFGGGRELQFREVEVIPCPDCQSCEDWVLAHRLDERKVWNPIAKCFHDRELEPMDSWAFCAGCGYDVPADSAVLVMLRREWEAQAVQS